MKYQLRKHKNYLIIKLEQSRVEEGDVAAFKEKFLSLIKLGELHLIVDCEGVEFIEAEGLKWVTTLARSIKEKNGALAIAHCDGFVAEMITLMGITAQIEKIDNIEEFLDF